MNCTFLVPSGEPCGRTVVAEYFDTDELRGWVLVASLCARHDNPAARRYALAKGIERVTVPGEPVVNAALGERAQTLGRMAHRRVLRFPWQSRLLLPLSGSRPEPESLGIPAPLIRRGTNDTNRLSRTVDL